MTALDRLETPALLLDERRLDRNIATMARRALASGLELWPHAKTHKCTRVGARQRAAGAAGLTVATVREAEAFAAAGLAPLLLAQPPVGDWRIARLLAVAREHPVRVALDSAGAAVALDRACVAADVSVEVLWEVDCGLGRTGTAPGEPTAAAVAELVRDAERLRFAGLLTYPGHVYGADGRAAVRAVAREEERAQAITVGALARADIPTRVRSVGSTPTAPFFGEQPTATQARPGNYPFCDATQVALGAADLEDCALSVLGTVLSRPDPGRIVLDCGSKSLAAERMTPGTRDLGLVLGHPELRVQRLYEEHAVITGAVPIAIGLGERLRIVPNHACTATNLHDELHLVRDGAVLETWRLDARGWAPPAAAHPD